MTAEGYEQRCVHGLRIAPYNECSVCNRASAVTASLPPEANELAQSIRDARRYKAIKRSWLNRMDLGADDYGYEAERFDKEADELAERWERIDK